jgi:hypothetical protein
MTFEFGIIRNVQTVWKFKNLLTLSVKGWLIQFKQKVWEITSNVKANLYMWKHCTPFWLRVLNFTDKIFRPPEMLIATYDVPHLKSSWIL